MHLQTSLPSRWNATKQSLQERLEELSSSCLSCGSGRFAGGRLGPQGQAEQLIMDGVLFAASLTLAFLIRYGPFTSQHAIEFLFWLPILVTSRLLVNRTSGVYRFIWRFVCLSDAVVIAKSLLLVSSALLGLRLFYPSVAPFSGWFRLPIGIIALEFFQSLVFVLGARSVFRSRYERSRRSHFGSQEAPKRVLLYGAGRAGVLLAKELLYQPEVDIVGFIDDASEKQGTFVSGLPVLGNGQMIEKVVQRRRIDEVIISVAAASPASLAKIVARCRRVPVTAKIIPGIHEILSKEASISHIRDIRIEDLLGRGTVSVEGFDDRVRQAYRGKRILVTGAGGSIGSELTRQLLLLEPHKISILDKDENTIYDLEQELKFRNPQVPIEPLIADIKLRERLFAVFAESKPEVVLHAAAHKHVPLMEKHPCEAILNNILGTRNVLDACGFFGVRRFVFISSDKAVNPTNVMGATKRVGEKLVSTFARTGRINAACVRFGNVMGSRGSVIPLFQNQILKGGPVTVTHPNIVRFFMTIPEAVQLVLCAGSLAGRGDVFVLDMGSPRRILDLAYQMIVLCGLEPEKDIEIAITGLRPGEKMNEELVASGESLLNTRFEKINAIHHPSFDLQIFRDQITRIIKAAQRNDKSAVYDTLAAMELGFTPYLSPVSESRDSDYAMVS